MGLDMICFCIWKKGTLCPQAEHPTGVFCLIIIPKFSKVLNFLFSVITSSGVLYFSPFLGRLFNLASISATYFSEYFEISEPLGIYCLINLLAFSNPHFS